MYDTPVYRSTRPLANVVMGLMALAAAFSLGELILSVMNVATYNAFLAGTADYTALTRSDEINVMFGGASLYIGLPTLMIGARWIYRSAANAKALDPMLATFTPGWAVGWYFVPFANLVRPLESMKQMFFIAESVVDPTAEDARQPILSWWWGLYIFSGVATYAVTQLFVASEDLPAMITANQAMVFSSVLSAASAGLFAVVVHRLSRKQDAAFTTLQMRAYAAGPGADAMRAPADF